MVTPVAPRPLSPEHPRSCTGRAVGPRASTRARFPGRVHLPLPNPPTEPSRSSVPVLAMLAPVVGALVLWAVLQSPTVLAIAALGPVIGIASLADGARSRRGHRGRERARFRRECAALAERIDDEHDRERVGLARAHPDARSIAGAPPNDPHRWRWRDGEPLAVHVGTGPVPSVVQIEPYQPGQSAEVEAAGAELVQRAATVEGPVVVDARLGIGIVGPDLIATAIARGLVVQLLQLLAPGHARVLVEGPSAWAWLDGVPHELVEEHGDRTLVRVVAETVEATIVLATSHERLPRDCRVTLTADLADCAVDGVHVVPTVLSAVEARAAVATLGEAAEQAGLRTDAVLPSRLGLDDLEQPVDGVLAARFLASGSDVVLDLAVDGPHAVVGGTTGAGKSELLIAWVTALAMRHSPQQLAVLLIDFKGGASFGALSELRHCVGVITDLDEHQALRAIESLRAEIRHRERALARLGARSIDEAPGLERLVIVVDEFAAMLHELPDLHRLFVDIAARGRSLGMHLILCTQRPAEAVRDAVLANCGLRISLRVTDEADAVAVTGTKDAAHILLEQRGRCVVRVAGAQTMHAQSAMVAPPQLEALVRSSRAFAAPRRPWCDPLPQVVEPDGLTARGVPLGLVDRPAEQRVDAVGWEPETQGPLLALGAAASGKSALVRLLARAGGEVVADEEALWDALHEPLTAGLTVIDDIDLLLARSGDEHAAAMSALLATRMREGIAHGRAVALTARRITTAMAQIAPLADTRVLLRLASRQEHAIAGGATDRYDPMLPPGGAWIAGERVQLAFATDAIEPRAAQRTAAPSDRVAIVVPTEAEASALGDGTTPADVLAGTHGDRVAGTPAQWEAAWGAIDRLRAERAVLVLGIEDRVIRSLVRGAPLAPVTRGARRFALEAGTWRRLA